MRIRTLFIGAPLMAAAFVLSPPTPRRAVRCGAMGRPAATMMSSPTPTPVSVFDAEGDDDDVMSAKEDIVQVVRSYYDQRRFQAATHSDDWTFTPGLGWVGPASNSMSARTIAAKVFAPATLMCQQTVAQSVEKMRDFKEKARCVSARTWEISLSRVSLA